jgi:hypothetical protein
MASKAMWEVDPETRSKVPFPLPLPNFALPTPINHIRK